MNSSQKKYAIERVSSIVTKKINQAEKLYTIGAITLTFSAKYQLIRTGKVILLPMDKLRDYVDLVDAYDFSKHERSSSFQPEFEKKKKELIDLLCQTKDEIMLGNSKEAIDLIAKLESFKI